MLYQLKKNKNIYETSPGLRLIPEFDILDKDTRLGDRLMRFVMLVADYDSPLKQQPEKRRRELAILSSGGKVQEDRHESLDMRSREIVAGRNANVEAALKKYREIQYNEDRETLLAINQQIETIRETIMKKTDDVGELKKRNDLISSLPELIETKKKIAKMASIEEEVFESESAIESRPMSLIDKVALENQNKE